MRSEHPMRTRLIHALLLLSLGTVPANVSAQSRELLYAASPGEELRTIAANLQDPNHSRVPDDKLTSATRYYVRLAPRQHVITPGNELLADAVLGTKPYVFLAKPEAFYGKSLLDIYLEIGYEAEDIIRR